MIYLGIIYSLILLLGVVFAFTFLIFIKFLDERNHNLYLHGKLNPYKRKKYFLTLPEKELFEILQEFVSDKEILIFPQLHLSTLLEVNEDQNDLLGKFNWINKLYVDFVLFDKKTIQPLLVIELNDPTHFWNNRKARDQFVKNALSKNNISQLTISSQELTKTELILSKIQNMIEMSKT